MQIIAKKKIFEYSNKCKMSILNPRDILNAPIGNTIIIIIIIINNRINNIIVKYNNKAVGVVDK